MWRSHEVQRIVAAVLLIAACGGEPPPQPPAVSIPQAPRAATPAPETSAPPPAEPAPEPRVEPLPTDPAERIAAAQSRLRDTGFKDEAIPSAARPLVAAMKQASLELIRREVAKVDLAHVADDKVQAAIEDTARAAGVDVAVNGSTDVFGWYVSVTRSKGNPRYTVIGYYYGLPCGYDAGYALYEAAGSHLLLTLSSPESESTASMFWDLSFSLPPAGSKDFFFVAKRITPGCQSALRRLQLIVLRPGATPEQPQRLVDEEVNFHLLGEYGLDVKAKEVKLTFTPDTPDGREVRRWRIDSTGASRIP